MEWFFFPSGFFFPRTVVFLRLLLVRAATAEVGGTSATSRLGPLKVGDCDGPGGCCRKRRWCAGRPAREMWVKTEQLYIGRLKGGRRHPPQRQLIPLKFLSYKSGRRVAGSGTRLGGGWMPHLRWPMPYLPSTRWAIVRQEADSCTRAGGFCRLRLRSAVQVVTERRVAAPMLPTAPPVHCTGVHRGTGGCTRAADRVFGARYRRSPRGGWRHPHLC